MRKFTTKAITGIAFLALMVSVGCSDSNPLSAFEPEIVNNPDAFEFQITDADNVSTVVRYAWSNSGMQATIDHSTITDKGSATVELIDANGTVVYSSDLKASGTEQASAGQSGIWTITITFDNYTGTSNFRVQAL